MLISPRSRLFLGLTFRISVMSSITHAARGYPCNNSLRFSDACLSGTLADTVRGFLGFLGFGICFRSVVYGVMKLKSCGVFGNSGFLKNSSAS